jgi:hypothetical protein
VGWHGVGLGGDEFSVLADYFISLRIVA